MELTSEDLIAALIDCRRASQIKRDELTNEQWSLVRGQFPKPKNWRGRPRHLGVFWRQCSGCCAQERPGETCPSGGAVPTGYPPTTLPKRTFATRSANTSRTITKSAITRDLIEPGPELALLEGRVVCRERLGGLLRYYHRAAA